MVNADLDVFRRHIVEIARFTIYLEEFAEFVDGLVANINIGRYSISSVTPQISKEMKAQYSQLLLLLLLLLL